ncbi:kinase-like domain-containing protein [Hyaloraphidium curvatum]|nr:kinase-like domain-containing protein [Hyaloraphidium curvatum]
MVYFFELLDDRNHFHIFTELCEGDMHRYIETHAPLDERTSARVVTLLLRTLATLHAQGIVHRDVKGQNIFLRDMKDPLSIALGDLHSCAVLPPDSASSQPFGPAAGLPDDKSSVFSRDAALQTATGTPLCLSPEVVRGKPYGPKVDVWAAGILLFQLFCRRTPFEDSANYADLYRRIAAADYVVPPLSFPPGAADLLSRLLEPDPSRRPTAAEALRHPWLVATAGDFEPPPRLAGMDAGVAAARGAPPESAGEGSDAGEEDTTGSTLVHPLMMSGAQVDFNFETGSLRVAHPPAKP